MRGRLLILSVLLFIVVLASPSWAELTCGAVIGPSEVVTLTEDLVCPPGTGPPALTVESSSILNLGGHTVNCGNRFRVGIQMNGGGSIAQDGTVTNCSGGVIVLGDGGHAVTKITATGNVSGFRVGSDGNEIRSNTAKENVTGFFVPGGNRNTFKANLARDNSTFGFFMSSGNPGNENTFTKNRAICHGKF